MTEVEWSVFKEFALEYGPIVALLALFIYGLATKRVAWGWQVVDKEREIAELKTESKAMLEIVKTNVQTADRVAALLKSIEETTERWDEERRRRKST